MRELNKAMDGLGVPLEEATAPEVNGVIAPSGWTPGQHLKGPVLAGDPPGADSVATRLGLIRYAPRTIKLDKAWTAGVPNRWPAVGEHLRQRTGHPFPVLSRLRNRRAIRAIATMIKDNLGESAIGLDHKLAAGLIYAHTVDNPSLAAELRAIGARELPDSPTLAAGTRAAPPARLRWTSACLRHLEQSRRRKSSSWYRSSRCCSCSIGGSATPPGCCGLDNAAV